MDNETLSNYGWIVICVLVLAVMIALATPFGKFISNAVQNTTQGLFDVNQKALNQTGLITIADQEFDVPDGNGETGETPAPVPGATFNRYLLNQCSCITHSLECFSDEITPVTLSWEELKDPANGAKYGYYAPNIKDETISGFYNCYGLTSITFPSSLISIDSVAFQGCTSLAMVDFSECVNLTDIGGSTAFNGTKLTNIDVGNTKIICFDVLCDYTSIVLPNTVTYTSPGPSDKLTNVIYKGKISEWNAILLGPGWHYPSREITVTCTDGTIIIPADN